MLRIADMNAAAPTMPSSSLQTDEELAQLLTELTHRVRSGENPDIESIVKRHPQWAAELRLLWPTILIAEALAKPAEGMQVEPPLPSPALPPLRSFGDYDLLEELGRGGMGVVYKARQRSLQRTVALKMIRRGDLASPGDLVRFRAEAESAARLDHQGIVPVHEIGEIDGQPYFSMKYVEGTTLAHKLADASLPPREAAQYLLGVARAVDFAHRSGILHRDLKPSNILIDRDGQVHVTDFGLAKRIEVAGSLTQSGAILGTPSYMAPEQAAGGRGTLSAASDVFSLGAILYEMLTGRPPFRAASPVDTIMLVLEQDPLLPRLLNPKVDRELEMICLKCLQKPADLRYPSAARLADDLQAFLHGEPISTRSSNIGYVLARMLRPTHHAAVLENWGMLWMWNGLVLFVLCAATNWMQWRQITSPWPYLGLWGVGLTAWALIFWALRQRSGPVTFVERQIAHAWGAGVSASIGLFILEILLGLPVLTLAPVMAVVSGMVFIMKAGTLSGSFYVAAAVQYLVAVLMTIFPAIGLTVFGISSAACFFLPGFKYYRQRAREKV